MQSWRDTFCVRAFLYFTVHLRELFSGDGYTYEANGKQGMKEYICPNRSLSDLGDHEIVEIDVQLPIQQQIITVKKGTISMKMPSFWDVSKAGKIYTPDITAVRAEARKAGLISVPAQLKRNSRRNLLVGIDWENDFMEYGRLPVPNSLRDLVNFCERMLMGAYNEFYTDYLLSIDGHPPHAIHTDSWWKDEQGNNPDVAKIPMQMQLEDPSRFIFKGLMPDGSFSGKYFHPTMMRKYTTSEYAPHLQQTGQGNIWVFADHCHLGTDGINLPPLLVETLEFVCAARNIQPIFIHKGHIAQTDWFGIYEPCMIINDHPQGQAQTVVLDMISDVQATGGKTDNGGEAEDFCVANTMIQTERYHGSRPEVLKSIRFLKDCTSPIVAGSDFLKARTQEMVDKGIQLINHDEF